MLQSALELVSGQAISSMSSLPEAATLGSCHLRILWPCRPNGPDVAGGRQQPFAAQADAALFGAAGLPALPVTSPLTA